MAPKKRKDTDENLPTNLHRDGVYLKYWNTQKKKYKYLGRCSPSDVNYKTKLREIIEAVLLANAKIESKKESLELLAETSKLNLSETIASFRDDRVAEVGARRSKQDINNRLNEIDAIFGEMEPNSITARMLTEWLAEHSHGIQKKYKTELVKLFDFALSIGHRELTLLNPARVLLLKAKPQKLRQRLTFENYNLIYNQSPPWLKVAMDITLHTTLRPVDVVQLKYGDFDGTSLKTVIRKSRKVNKAGDYVATKHLRIELNEAEQAIIKNSRDDIASPYIVHRVPKRKSKGHDKDHFTQLTVDYMSREFSQIRNDLELFSDLDDEQKPTLYEIRALSSDLYNKAGRDKSEIQKLMAHTDGETTEIYLDGHSVEYETVKAGLKI